MGVRGWGDGAGCGWWWGGVWRAPSMIYRFPAKRACNAESVLCHEVSCHRCLSSRPTNRFSTVLSVVTVLKNFP